MNISMGEAIYAFPEHLGEAQALCDSFRVPKWAPDQVLVVGMGGSAIGGDLLQAIADQHSQIPVRVIRDEKLPEWINHRTLAVAVSYSGNTQETLTSVSILLKSPAKLIVVCTGGTLKEIASSRQIPCLVIPGGLMPRAALAFTFVPLLNIYQQISGLPKEASDLSEAVRVLRAMRKNLEGESANNVARVLARQLREKLPLIYAPTSSFAPAAKRWKAQINENAKHPASGEVFPEATHNDIVGFSRPLPIHKMLAAVFLRDSQESPLVKKRIDFMQQSMKKVGVSTHEVKSEGITFVTRLLSLCYYGDYVSLYLAQENQVDPIPIAVIDELKKELSAVRPTLGTLT